MPLPIPKYAKEEARAALKARQLLVKSKMFGLDIKTAKKLGINSGIAQARHLISNKFLVPKKAREFYRFYQRFKNCKTPRCEGALKLWGGRRFLAAQVVPYVRKMK